jgi:purine-binding chemotaxis protein CheW
MDNQLVVFDLANEHYGVDIGTVDRIIYLQPITAVPQAPPFVEGITNLRGMVLPVVDLRKRFGLPIEGTNGDGRIVVVEMGDTRVGMIVDGVSEVLHVSEDDIEPPSPLVTSVDSSFITGIAKVDERLVILLDLDKVLSSEEQAGLQALTPDTGAEE